MVMVAETGRTRDAISRARRIAGRIAKGEDLRVRAAIAGFGHDLDYADRTSLCIVEDAWVHVIGAGIEPRMVFAHPDVIKANPDASLHYRGIALLSRKRVQEIVGSVDAWERSPATARVSDAKALKVCCLYNAVISSLIVDHTQWTMDDGYRNILATMGITEDGAIRNIIGQEAELAVKKRLVDWVRSRGLLTSDGADDHWQLIGGIRMLFGSEPDIGFERDGKWAVIVEVKGGKDPAGALERLGAIKKTFDEAPVDCKSFLVVGVVTATMRERLREMRMEADFDIDQLLDDEHVWTAFMNEIFHHGLRIAPEA